MPNYRRAWHPGGTYFFTANLLERRDSNLLVRYIDALRAAVRRVRRAHSLIHAWEHLNRLPCAHGLRSFQPAEDRLQQKCQEQNANVEAARGDL